MYEDHGKASDDVVINDDFFSDASVHAAEQSPDFQSATGVSSHMRSITRSPTSHQQQVVKPITYALAEDSPFPNLAPPNHFQRFQKPPPHVPSVHSTWRHGEVPNSGTEHELLSDRSFVQRQPAAPSEASLTAVEPLADPSLSETHTSAPANSAQINEAGCLPRVTRGQLDCQEKVMTPDDLHNSSGIRPFEVDQRNLQSRGCHTPQSREQRLTSDSSANNTPDKHTPGSVDLSGATYRARSCIQRTRQDRDPPLLRPLTQDSRVTKYVSRSPLLRPQQSQPGWKASQGPTEEDLLLLLMRRTRTREDAESRLTREQERLRRENACLLQDKLACQQEYQDTRRKWHADVQAHQVRQAEVQNFKEKYVKLKQWAQDMHIEYNILREESEKHRQQLSTLRHEGAEAAKETKGLLETCENIASKTRGIKDGISNMRTDMARYHMIEEKLSQEQERVREERLQNKTYALYIERLQSSQERINALIKNKHDGVAQELAKLSSIIKRQDVDSLNQSMMQILDTVNNLHQHDFAKSVDIIEMTSALATVEQHYTSLMEAVGGCKGVLVDQHSQLKPQLLKLLDAVHKLQPDLEKFQDLEKRNCMLAQREKDLNVAFHSAQRDKNAVQLINTGLLHVVTEATKIKSSVKESLERDSQLASSNSELRLMYQNKCNELTRLQTELLDAHKWSEELQASVTELQETHTTEMAQARKAQVDEMTTRTAEMASQLSAEGQKLTQIEAELKAVQQTTDEMQARFEQAIEAKKNLEAQLNSREAEISDKDEIIAQLQLKQQELETSVHSTKANEDRVLQLQTQISGLECVREQLIQTKCENHLLEENLQQAKAEQQDLARRIKDMEHFPEELTVLQETLAAQIILHERQAQDLTDAQTIARLVPDLKKDIESEKSKVSKLQASLRTAEVSTGQVSVLQGELHTSRERISQLAQSLDSARNKYEDLLKDHKDLKEKDDMISRLQARIKHLNQLEAQLDEMKTEGELKDIELANMHDHMNRLRGEVQQTRLIRAHFTEAELADLSEDVVLSMKSALQQSQSQISTGDNDGAGDKEQTDLIKTRRVADRGVHFPDDEVVVPDSQIQGPGNDNDLENIGALLSPFEAMEAMDELDTTLVSSFDTELEESVAPCVPFRTVSGVTVHDPIGKESARPSTSDSDMLLGSSDAGLHSQTTSQQKAAPQMLVPASAQEQSPMKTRNGSQIRHNLRQTTPIPPADREGRNASKISTPHSHAREHHAPNSAVKRRGVSEAPESSVKRPRNLRNLEVSQPKKDLVTARATCHRDVDDAASVYSLPGTGRKSVSVTGTSAPTPGKGKKKTTNTVRKDSKSAKYGERFGG